MKNETVVHRDNRSAARNAALVNLLVMPGMGSLLAGRILAGLGQMFTGGIGFALLMIWFVGVMIRYYGLMFGQETSQGFRPSPWMAIVGAALFIISWLWALITSIGLLREASREASRRSLEATERGDLGTWK